MYFRAVELPNELIQAHRDNRLVIFVGAGASRAAPSNLPDFGQLTRDIIEDAHASDLDLDEGPDVLLGRLIERGVDVKRLVAQKLSPAGSQPNDLHRAIVALATAGPAVRIVTTNYDRHLSTALDAANVDVDEYRAPALPMGDDFDGIVYLHGSLDRDPRHLVVTDQDFGRAYLRDAWAARFLERMYATYTVLFIGYSVSDIVMRYLARSLSDVQPRFALTHQPGRSDWRSLQIGPVGYDAESSEHSHLTGVIDEWATEASRGLLDHRQRVRELVTSPPSGIPDEESYLEATITDPVRVRSFVEFADQEDWLTWLHAKPSFRPLFNPRAVLEPESRELAGWFVERFVLREDRTATALTAVADAGGRLSPELWQILGQGLNGKVPASGWLGPWLVLMVEQAPPGSRHQLEYFLADARLPDERAAALLLFDHLTQPTGDLPPPILERAKVDVDVAGHDHWLREAWTEQLAPALPEIAPDILATADRHLRRAHQLLAVADANAHPFDPLSFRRSAIYPHPQDTHPEPFDVLLDAARDSLEAALDASFTLAVGYLESWSASSVPLLQRLAVHGWAHRSDVRGVDKLEWLLEHDWIFNDTVRAELFHLLKHAVDDLDEPGASRLVDAIARGPESDNEDRRDRARFDLLQVLLEARPDLAGGCALLDEIQARHPEWEPSEHPELAHTVQSGFRRPNPPMTVDELHQKIQNDPTAAVHELLEFQDADFSLTEPTWEDTLGLTADTVREHPTDGLSLLEHAGDGVTAIAPAAIRGWSQAALTEEATLKVLDRIPALELGALTHEVADLLADGGQRESHPTQWFRLEPARDLARELWTKLQESDFDPPPDDWLGRAINHPAGKVAQFWIQAVASDWRAAEDSWEGLPVELTEPLEQMLSGDGFHNALAETVIASQLRFLHSADPDWTLQYVLPLLDWADPDRALRAWNGYLFWGRPTRPLLEAGLLEHYLTTATMEAHLSDELRRLLARHLAGIATSSAQPPDTWVGRFTRAATTSLRTEWLEAITWILRDLPADEVVAQWRNWLRPYWEQRLASIPVSLTLEEASTMAGWAPYLGTAISECVELVKQAPAALDQDRLLLPQLDTAEESAMPPAEPVAELLAHLLKHTTEALWDCRALHLVVTRVRTEARPATLQTIREEALRLGCVDAPNW